MKDRNGKTLRAGDVCVVRENRSGIYCGLYNGVIVEFCGKSSWPKNKDFSTCLYYNSMFRHVGRAPFEASSLEIIGDVRPIKTTPKKK